MDRPLKKILHLHRCPARVTPVNALAFSRRLRVIATACGARNVVVRRRLLHLLVLSAQVAATFDCDAQAGAQAGALDLSLDDSRDAPARLTLRALRGVSSEVVLLCPSRGADGEELIAAGWTSSESSRTLPVHNPAEAFRSVTHAACKGHAHNHKLRKSH